MSSQVSPDRSEPRSLTGSRSVFVKEKILFSLTKVVETRATKINPIKTKTNSEG